MKYKHPNDKKIALCAVLAVLCVAAFVASILRIALDKDAPSILVFALFVAAVGFTISLSFTVRFSKERAIDKKSGVIENRTVEKRKFSSVEILCLTAIGVSGLIIVLAIVFLCYPGIAPVAATLTLLVVGVTGYNAGVFGIRFLNAKSLKEKAEKKLMEEVERDYDAADEANAEDTGQSDTAKSEEDE